MAKIKCRLHSVSDNSSIFLQLSLGRGRVYERKTGLSIDSRAWSKETGYPKQTLAQHKKLAKDIKKLEGFVYEQLNESESRGETIDGSWLGENIDIFFGRKSRSGHSESVLYWIDHMVNNADMRKNSKGGRGLSKSRIQQYKQLKVKFAEFQGRKHYKIKDINQALGKEFLTFLMKEKGYMESYALKILENLKSVCYEAELYVEVSPQVRKIESSKPKNKYIVYLSPKELEKIAKADIIPPHLQNARKWLLLGCWIGQRGGDLLKITEDSIKEEKGFKYFEVRQEKTGKTVQVPILPQAQQIIDSGLPQKIAIQNLNNYLKDVCSIAKIDKPTEGSVKNPVTNRKVDGIYPKYELIGTHVCRRSFCTNLYGELPTPVIMQASGHSTEKTFLNYIGKTGMDYREHWTKMIERESKKRKKKSNLKVVSNKAK